MKTEPNWRANISFRSSMTSVSFQGEYPGAMTLIDKGTLFSFGSLAQIKTGLVTKFIFSNLRAKPGSSDPCKIRFAQMRKQKVLIFINLKAN